MDSHQYRVDLPESSDMASEPVGFYNDAAYKIRHSAIVSEISRLGKNETIWLIRTMQQHLEDLSQKMAVERHSVSLMRWRRLMN